LNRVKKIYDYSSDSPVKTLALYRVEQENILEDRENQDVKDHAGTKRAGEKLEIQSKQIVKETKNENLREIN
jgi:hypothetical protein